MQLTLLPVSQEYHPQLYPLVYEMCLLKRSIHVNLSMIILQMIQLKGFTLSSLLKMALVSHNQNNNQKC